MPIDDVKVVVGEDEFRDAIQDFFGVPRETYHEGFRRSIRELATARGMTAAAAAELADHVGKSSDTWPSMFVVNLDMAETLPDSTVAFLCHLGLVPIDSLIVTDEIRAELTKPIKDDDRYRGDLRYLAGSFADSLGHVYDHAFGLTDAEIEDLHARIRELPAALGPVLQATSSNMHTLFSLLGLSNLPLPEKYYGNPDYRQKLDPEPDAPTSGVDHLRRALWRLADDPSKTVPELHVHIESTLARMLDLPEFFQHSIATWTYRVPDSARAFLLATKTIDETSPLSGGPAFLTKTRVPLVRHPNGRWIAHIIARDSVYTEMLWGVDTAQIEKRLYNETPALIYPILLHLSREEATCVVDAFGFLDRSQG